jgi:muramoyltetrapeptide carboxypeptidase LdcA involved in peptidoglycan recycling
VRPLLEVPRKLRPGEPVAVVSPSFAAPGRYPEVHELAMRRLRDEIGLEPVEYPTTRRIGATLEDRAADLTAAFCDPGIGAILATVGGDDQIGLLRHLDTALVSAHPKAFVGYSDNTNLLNWLWNLGIAGYHGGSTMVHLGRGGSLHPISAHSLRTALFDDADITVHPVERFSEEPIDWSDPRALLEPGPTAESPGWSWYRPDRVVTGPTWGGNVEVVHWNLATGRFIRPAEDYAGCILIAETSEEMPEAEAVFRMLRDAGERGLLEQFPAVIWGLPKATDLHRFRDPAARAGYRSDQRGAVLRAFDTYNPSAMIVFGVDIGHTDPQWVLPYGGLVTVDGPNRSITAHYAAGPVDH